ncbi:MAG: helix-turn-helix transcriptional regulator [Shewanella sp.]|nr:helix-turn-helix transcriptional regulator [Shewanella sp.]
MEFLLQQKVKLFGFHEANHCDFIQFFEQAIASKPFKIPATGRRFVSRYIQILDLNYHRCEFTHLEAAGLLSISHRQLHRKLSTNIGMNFSLSLKKYRLRKAALFCYSELQVTQIVDRVGFSSCSYFVKCFKQEFGVTPKQYQLELN